MGLREEMVNVADERIRQAATKTREVGTFVAYDESGQYAMVAFDGSPIALPCKFVGGLQLAEDTRVTVELFAGKWTVTNSFSRSPAVLTPALLNGWSNYGNGFAPATYWRGIDGEVHLEGMIAGGTTTSGTNLLQLDAGYRPNEALSFTVVTLNGHARIDVHPDGFVKASTGVNATFLALNGAQYLARQ